MPKDTSESLKNGFPGASTTPPQHQKIAKSKNYLHAIKA